MAVELSLVHLQETLAKAVLKFRTQYLPIYNNDNNNNNNNNNNLLLIRRKLTSEYDQMRLTTKTTPNNYNKIYLIILEINNLKSSQSKNNRRKPS